MGYRVERFVNGQLVTRQELSLHTITDKSILDAIDRAIAKNNQRYQQ